MLLSIDDEMITTINSIPDTITEWRYETNFFIVVYFIRLLKLISISATDDKI